MPIIDNEPCRYCGRNDGAHALTCDFGIAEFAARVGGIKQAHYELQLALQDLRNEIAQGNVRSAIEAVIWLEKKFVSP